MKTHIKIGLALLIGYILAGVASSEVFIANTPQIRENLPQYIGYRLQNVGHLSRYYLAKAFNKLPEQKLKDKVLEETARGVYAKSDNNNSYTVVREGEVEWIEHHFFVDGKEVKIRVPKGQQPPSQEMVEILYK